MKATLKATLALFLVAAGLAAFTHTGSVRSGGRAIPGATIRAAQGDQKIATTTDEEGLYILELPGPGAWTVEVGR